MSKLLRMCSVGVGCAVAIIALMIVGTNAYSTQAGEVCEIAEYESGMPDAWSAFDLPYGEVGGQDDYAVSPSADSWLADEAWTDAYDSAWTDAYEEPSADYASGANGAESYGDDLYGDAWYGGDPYGEAGYGEACLLPGDLPLGANPEPTANKTAEKDPPEKKTPAPPATDGGDATTSDSSATDSEAAKSLPREGFMPANAMRSHGDMSSSRSPAQDRKWVDHDDQVFLSAMIAHHQAAIEMAKAVLPGTKDPQVRQWALGIIKEQEGEIGLMHSLLVKYGGEDQEAMDRMNREMTRMLAGMPGEDADLNFVSMMIPHHAGAIDMSLPVLTNSLNPQLRQLAENIIVAQTKEIAAFQGWLAEHRQVAKAVS